MRIIKKQSFRKIGRFIASRFLPKGIAYPIVFGPLQGFRFILGAAAGEGGGVTVLFNLIEPEQSQAFIDEVKSGMVLFDIGANVGYYTLLGSRLVGVNGIVLSVEPVVRNISYLWRHIEKNKLKNVKVLPVACSNIHTGIVGFCLGDNVAEGFLESLLHTEGKGDTWTSVVTVDMIAKQTGLCPNVIKIDVEGAELAVLQGAKDTLSCLRPKIFLSVHTDGLRIACLEFLHDLGYSSLLLSNIDKESSEYYAYWN